TCQRSSAFAQPSRRHQMNRHVETPLRHGIAICGTLVLGTALMLSADASRDSKWSEWSTPVNLGAGINTPFVDSSPAISQDGLTLYFNSNRPGVPPDAFGDGDLYVAKRERADLPFNAPVNLGDRINTAGFEGFPALSRNEHHLFFARSPGDIWMSYRKDVHYDFGDSGWETPVPLGPGVNTSNLEQGPSYFENRKRGCRSSSSTAFGPALPPSPRISTSTSPMPSAPRSSS